MASFDEALHPRNLRGRFAKKLGDSWKLIGGGKTVSRDRGSGNSTVIENTPGAKRREAVAETVDAAIKQAQTPMPQQEKDKLASFASRYDFTVVDEDKGPRVKNGRAEVDVKGVTYGGLAGRTQRETITVGKPVPPAPKGSDRSDRDNIENAATESLMDEVKATQTTLNNAKQNRRAQMNKLLKQGR